MILCEVLSTVSKSPLEASSKDRGLPNELAHTMGQKPGWMTECGSAPEHVAMVHLLGESGLPGPREMCLRGSNPG